jgi:hypothetical protein
MNSLVVGVMVGVVLIVGGHLIIRLYDWLIYKQPKQKKHGHQ